MCVGGTADPPVLANTEQYDGTSWTETGDLGTARSSVTGFGTTALGLVAGGTPTGVVSTEEFDASPEAAKTVTVS